MPLTEQDQKLLLRCLARQGDAWSEFVERFLGLVVHVVHHTAETRGVNLTPADQEDLCGDVLLAVMRDDFAVLRHFRGQSSLATYLSVVSRRVCIREMVRRKLHHPAGGSGGSSLNMADPARVADPNGHREEERIENREEVERLLQALNGEEATAVRLYHLEGRSYREISETLGVAENSVGPLLSRARERLRSGAGAGV